MKQNKYNLDILDFLADLSNDEVKTPPRIAKQMIEILPSELFTNPNSKFLDPFTKSGVFLRTIVEKLIIGLESQFPDIQQRVDHILNNMVFGVSITKQAGMIARRSLYCSKSANSEKSISKFNNPDGNIRYLPSEHKWKNDYCWVCKKNKYDTSDTEQNENYAYSFIHNDELIEELKDMKFDVIIGNPPYQLDSGGFGAQAIPIYQHFVEQAFNLNAKYVCMIIPSRWFSGGMGLDDFRKKMISSKNFKNIVDYPNAKEAFPAVELKGGVMYFLWDRDYSGKCSVTNFLSGKENSALLRNLNDEGNVFIRLNESVSILNKIRNKKINTLEEKVSAINPFNLATNFNSFDKESETTVKIFRRGGISYLEPLKITKNKELLKSYKLLLPKACDGSGTYPISVIPKPILAGPGTACTMTYICVGNFKTKKEALGLSKYLETKFARYLISLVKNTQDLSKSKFMFVPSLDLDVIWDDKKLYKFFNLTKEEIKHIDEFIIGA